MNGNVAIILTAHVPYLRTAGRQPAGEDALHEAIARALIPTINSLYDLREQGIAPYVGLAYSPVLLNQLADNVVQKHFITWMHERLARLEATLADKERVDEAHHAYLAKFFLDWERGVLHSFEERYNRNLVNALRKLGDDGIVEPLAGAATHPRLPLLAGTRSLRAQLDLGMMSVTRWFGRRPEGFWLPELNFFPSLLAPLAELGTRYLVVDPSSLPMGPPYAHLQPRWTADHRLVTFTRSPATSTYLWSEQLGYASDPLYLAFGTAWNRNGMGSSDEPYDPYHAFRRVQEHARHFADVLAAQLSTFFQQHKRPGIAVVPLDATMLGSRWFEGAAWLRSLIECISSRTDIALTTPGGYIQEHRITHQVVLREGEWSEPEWRTWAASPSPTFQQQLQQAEHCLTSLATRLSYAQGWQERVLNQAARELLLAQSGGVIGGVEAPREARSRAEKHLKRSSQLCELVEQAQLSEQDEVMLETLEEEDNPFAYLNYRMFLS
jgi:1,4-alpha-glucan branching enzyme